jgi:hypothetical protein
VSYDEWSDEEKREWDDAWKECGKRISQIYQKEMDRKRWRLFIFDEADPIPAGTFTDEMIVPIKSQGRVGNE